MTFIRENAAAIAYELWACYWFVRCKLANSAALVALVLIEYAQRRGERSFVARWFARRFVGLARRLMPGVLRPLLEIASLGESREDHQ